MKINYRPEIDGLRSIAVVSVILYHAQIIINGHQPFKGGFIGVDIFFVISGYLITSIILKELLTTGSFSFKHFYERRVRRILPALLFVMLVSFIFAWIYLLPSSFVNFSKSVLYSLGFSSNFFFHFTETQYGAESAQLIPLLHTWSLSVEEQYYILFPIVLLFIFKYLKRYLFYILILGFFSSLILADWLSIYAPYLNFYILPTRVWEIVAGSILAYFELTKGRETRYKILNLVLPSIGLILIAQYILLSDYHTNHPSFKTLPPIIGVCLIIWFSNKDEIVTKILSTKLFVGVGLISYSLYLWHYPFFAFSRIADFTNEDTAKKFMLGLAVFLFSIFSYYFIERPARNKNYKFKSVLISLILVASIIVPLSTLVINKDGFKDRFSDIYVKNNIDNFELSNEAWRDIAVFNDKKINNQKFVHDDKIKVLVIGDSHAIDLLNTFMLNKDLFKEFEFLTYLSQFFWRYSNTNFRENEKSQDLLDFEKSKSFRNADIILISFDFFRCRDFSNCRSLKNLDLFIDLYKKNKKIILTSNANHYFSVRYKHFYYNTLFDYYLLKYKWGQKFIDKDLSNEEITGINRAHYFNKWDTQLDEVNAYLKNISKKHNIKFLNKQDFECNIKDKICYGITDDGYKTHHDASHYTYEGAKFFGKKIYEQKWFEVK
ncbi:acyltransferase [Candidatus Pelagibacter sp.]|nr:acyltransferase [Candidatus Pelagibacter sp.]